MLGDRCINQRSIPGGKSDYGWGPKQSSARGKPSTIDSMFHLEQYFATTPSGNWEDLNMMLQETLQDCRSWERTFRPLYLKLWNSYSSLLPSNLWSISLPMGA